MAGASSATEAARSRPQRIRSRVPNCEVYTLTLLGWLGPTLRDPQAALAVRLPHNEHVTL
jgi:hypothetical protein